MFATMYDVPYLVTHILLQRMSKRCGELCDEASGLGEGTAERCRLEKRIVVLEQYKFPKPDELDAYQRRAIDQWRIPAGRSVRQRLKDKPRGRPERYRASVRAALEEKIQHPERKWRELAAKRGLAQDDLERQIYLLKDVLKREGIAIPNKRDYQMARKSFENGLRRFAQLRRRDDDWYNFIHKYWRNGLTPETTHPTGPGFSLE
jgi:hypothetical protein